MIILGQQHDGMNHTFGEVTGSFIPLLSIASLMSILSKSFAAMRREELVTIIQLPALTAFFLIQTFETRSLISWVKPLD